MHIEFSLLHILKAVLQSIVYLEILTQVKITGRCFDKLTSIGLLNEKGLFS